MEPFTNRVNLGSELSFSGQDRSSLSFVGHVGAEV